MFTKIKDSLRDLYLSDPRPWLVGFSGGRDCTMVATLIFETIASLPEAVRTKPVSILSTDTRVEPERSGDGPPNFLFDFGGQIPAIVCQETLLPRRQSMPPMGRELAA